MQHAVVIGTGLMGLPIAYAMCRLNYKVTLVDANVNSLNHAAVTLSQLGMEKSIVDKRISFLGMLKVNDPPVDVVISAAPYKENVDIAMNCIKHNVRYCDLGGNPSVSKKIQDYASKTNKSIVFTDLGLAPGLANILAEIYYRSHIATDNIKPTKVKMKVGGLPSSPKDC